MFHFPHRLVILAFFGVLLALGFYVYQKRAIFDPLVDLAEVIRLPRTSRTVSQLTGKVVKVGNDYTFQMKEDQGVNYSLRLTGLEAPEVEEGNTNEVKALKESAQETLTQMILSNRVRVDLTFITEQRGGLGVAYLGETNINAALAEAGLAKVKREYLKGLPWKEQYRLIRAESKAQAKQSGIWNRSSIAAAIN